MRKELILAIFLGGFLGLAMAFGIWRFTNSFSKAPVQSATEETPKQPESETEKVQPPSTPTNGISIVRPRGNAVTSEDTVEIAGITKQNATVFIIADDDYIVRTNSGGTFQQEVGLSGGINTLPIYVFKENEEALESSVLITYSNDIENAESASSSYGTITDITENSLQIRTASGEISQVAISNSTSYVSTVKTTKDIKFEDLAIGDFVACIGQMDSAEILNADRIIVSSPPEETDDEIAFGTVKTLTNKEFVVSNALSGKEWSIDATDSPYVTSVNENGEISKVKLTSTAEEGDWIIIVGTMKDDELIARRIHIL